MVERKTTMRQLRERANLTQEELARKLGLTVSSISKWDQERTFPKLMPIEMANLMEILSCTLDELKEAQSNWITKNTKEKEND
ncbi:helix-turn-helix transcriptional regulator [Leptothoe sp. EHU-05/26/07-4]